jgi:hypothetical protein
MFRCFSTKIQHWKLKTRPNFDDPKFSMLSSCQPIENRTRQLQISQICNKYWSHHNYTENRNRLSYTTKNIQHNITKTLASSVQSRSRRAKNRLSQAIWTVALKMLLIDCDKGLNRLSQPCEALPSIVFDRLKHKLFFCVLQVL